MGSSRQEAVAAVFAGFRQGRREDVETVRRWTGAILYGGNWRFADPEAAQQEILLELVRMAGAGKIQDPAAFQQLVYTVAKHTCVDLYHRERARSRHEEAAEAGAGAVAPSDPEHELVRRERLDLLRYILQRLPESCRQLWDGVYRARRPAAEIAAELGITVTNLRVRVHRCAERARALVREHSAWPAGGAG
ncbi:MAG TPA: sigma-70 family RNA polymerase sigma factor [Candidatus Polarisedimenticolaceae bacterium]|nr:sigma-70 family RNA polymerase sigma factor [Candidatus Polarisedimenticolaceae bacterium]